MGIINLQTNLKSLKWGNDTQGGGDSGLPYIKTGLPENSTALERIALESAKFSADYPQRGGLYAVRAAAEDTIRIRKFLTDFPKGSNFTSKQVALQKSNPLIETGINGGRINTRTYNLNTNLLLSVATAGTGVNYPRAGATPLTLLDDDQKYMSIVGKKPKEENRLVNLHTTKILNQPANLSLLERLGISPDEFQIMNYSGGPGSLYGDGETTIFRATDYKGETINTNRDKPEYIRISDPLSFNVLGASNFLKKYYSGEELNQKLGIFEVSGTIRNEITNNDREKNTFQTFYSTLSYDKIIKKQQYIIGTSLTDFRGEIEPSGSVFSRNYSDPQIPMITRIGIGSPGARPRELRTNINSVFAEGQDQVNLIPIVHKKYSDNPEDEPGSRDLIKFLFETIDNNNINYTNRTHFRAFLKGFNDNHNADWSGKRYAGRGENLFTYQVYDRRINFNFTMSPQSKQEMKPLYQKLNYLASTLCADYSPGDGFMRGNIHRLTIGEYLYRMPGIITNLNFNIDDNYPWEIKMDQPEEGFDMDMMELPQLISVSVSFIPILDTLARTGYKTPLIMSDKVNRNFISNLQTRT